MPFKLNSFLRYYLTLGGIYLLLDALIHLFDIKLIDVRGIWPNLALIYGQFMAYLYASFAILASILAIAAARNLDKYKLLIVITGFWALFHGLLLILFSLAVDFEVFSATPSVFVWIPFYNLYLIFEGVLLIGLSLTIYFWAKKHHT